MSVSSGNIVAEEWLLLPPPKKNHHARNERKGMAPAQALKPDPSSKSNANPCSRCHAAVAVKSDYLGPTMKNSAKHRCCGDRVMSIDGMSIEP